MESLLSFETRRAGGACAICVTGELDIATSGSLEDELRRVEASDADRVILDLSGVTFMDSSGLRVVLAAGERSRCKGTRLRLVRGPEAVQAVFRLTGLEARLPWTEPGLHD
jgi:anti-anti-sigma factor